MKPLHATRLESTRHGRVGSVATIAPLAPPGVGSRLNAWIALIAAWQRRAHGRNELRRLDARLLRDIGLSEEQAGREMAKPFWRV